jgi:CHAD domain-containing protein
VMTPDPRVFELERGEPDQTRDELLAGALSALGQAFTVAADRTTPGGARRRRTWLDTFDWRLHGAGLTLEHEQAGTGGRLLLTGTIGTGTTSTTGTGTGTGTTSIGTNLQAEPGHEAVAAEQPAQTWRSARPALATDLPPGPVRDAVMKLVDPRALLPVAKASTIRTVMRLLNPDGKTVARLLLDRTTVTTATTETTRTTRSAAELAPRLSIAEVRGYPGQARRAAAVLAAIPGTAPATQSIAQAVLAALGRTPGDYTGKVDAPVTAGQPAAQAVATVLLNLLDTLERNVDGVLKDIDTEFLHDLRVAVRRTRSAIKLLGDVLPADLSAHYRAEFKWLGDVTTPVRDLDVYLLGFNDLTASLTAAAPADLDPLREFLARSRAREFRKLAAALRSPRCHAILHDWRKELTAIRDARPARGKTSRTSPPANTKTTNTKITSTSTSTTAAGLATARTGAAFRKIARQGAAIGPQSPPESLHDLRKRCKELRYLLEFFAPVYDKAAYKTVLADLKQLQDCLGQFQDSEVQREQIRALAQAMLTSGAPPKADTLLAMGEVTAKLAADQHRARDGFARRFARFAGPAGQARMTDLLARRELDGAR